MRDPRVDAYVEAAADFAEPILRHLRALVHEACPDVEESIKWSRPHFGYHGMMCGMVAFKEHCTFGFWKPELVAGDDAKAKETMERLQRITSLEDLPPRKVLVGFVRTAMRLNDEGVKPKRAQKPRKPKPEAVVPEDLAAALALKKNAKARATFEALSPSHRREYVAWIAEAKRAETRARRVEQTIAWLAEGKPRNWKYMGRPGRPAAPRA
jgi:uncharacterized protein YdeI (YjbR/CyaY-like superfamily)